MNEISKIFITHKKLCGAVLLFTTFLLTGCTKNSVSVEEKRWPGSTVVRSTVVSQTGNDESGRFNTEIQQSSFYLSPSVTASDNLITIEGFSKGDFVKHDCYKNPFGPTDNPLMVPPVHFDAGGINE